jgi:transposase-like protein
MTENRLPRTLIEAIRYFADLDVATKFVADLRWAGTPTCARCGSVENYYLSTRRIWKCKGCGRQFSVKVGTIFEDSPLGLDKWLPAVWLVANSKNGISSHELGRALGVTQKSAWFMLHRIRLAMQSGSFEKLDGIVEADETYIGGLAKNLHASQRAERNINGGTGGKTGVAGVLSRDGQVRATVIPSASGPVLQAFVRENVKKHATLYTDAWHAYRALGSDFDHAVVDHHLNQYVNGNVHTNG